MNVIYLTYDGLLDPLGDSQILPYIRKIRPNVSSYTIISFEKDHWRNEDFINKEQELKSYGINWIQVRFSSSQSSYGKIYDLIKMYLVLLNALFFSKIDLIHARGHPAGSVALTFKKIFKFKLVFDFRGLWADERVTKQGWNLDISSHRLQYRYYKSREKKLFIHSDHVIVLTEAVLQDILLNHEVPTEKFTVIPCAADFDHFNIIPVDNQDIGFQKNTFLVGYLGSIGPMYQFDAYVKLVKYFNEYDANAFGLIVTKDTSSAKSEITELLGEEYLKLFKIVNSDRERVPKFINHMSVLVAFYTISYSVISVSPTKIGEALACGVSIIANKGIGDTDQIIKQINSGLIIENTSDDILQSTPERFMNLKVSSRIQIRDRSNTTFGLDCAAKKYISIYESLRS